MKVSDLIKMLEKYPDAELDISVDMDVCEDMDGCRVFAVPRDDFSPSHENGPDDGPTHITLLCELQSVNYSQTTWPLNNYTRSKRRKK